MHIRTIDYKFDQIKIIDQTKLPGEFKYIYIKNIISLWRAIKKMQIRGAPALGAAAGLGMYLAVAGSRAKDFAQFSKELDRAASYLGSSRPTAKNLFWALERIKEAAVKNKNKPIAALKKLLLKEAKKIIQVDRAACRRIGFFGAKLIKDKDRILTICNAGILATIDYGTALGVIYRAKVEGKNIRVYASETRPLLQGARLTTWELQNKGIDVTLICDNMAATLMQQGKIDKIITGADRIAANADTANKIGTYNLAVLAHYHKIPFYVAAPSSTFDLDIESGKDIKIEQRAQEEVTGLFFKKRICAKGIKVFNPAFDVTPHNLITAIITEKGLIKPPFAKNISKVLCL